MAERNRRRRGQATLEFVLVYAAVLIPLTFGTIFVAEMLWVWHSVVEFTRDGARYAATHCYQGGGANVVSYMRTHVPRTVDQDQFAGGPAEIVVTYQSRDADSGQLVDFTCDGGGDCSTACIPDAVSVEVTGYQFRRIANLTGLQPVEIPSFKTSLPMESAGCDPEQGTCQP